MVFGIALWGSVAGTSASGPSDNRILNYQIRLSDDSGVAVPDGVQDLKLTIYDAAAAGNQLYTACSADGSPTGTPTAVEVTFTSALASVLIGDTGVTCASGTAVALPGSVFAGGAVYLGVTVGADPEMTPRKRIVSAPFAFNADLLDDLDTSAVGGTVAFVPVTDASGNLTLTRDLNVADATLFVDASSDRVGFGTTSPQAALHAAGTAVFGGDHLLDTNGSDLSSGGSSFAATIAEDDPLVSAAGQGLCTDSLSAPSVIYLDGNADCTAGNGGTDALIYGHGPATATVAVTDAWAFDDTDTDCDGDLTGGDVGCTAGDAAYQDGQDLFIDREPKLVYRSAPVGIGTDAPEANLHVSASGLGDVVGFPAAVVIDTADSGVWSLAFRARHPGLDRVAGFYMNGNAFSDSPNEGSLHLAGSNVFDQVQMWSIDDRRTAIGRFTSWSTLSVRPSLDVADIGGTTTANASTTITGSGTLFTRDLGVGDRISLSSAPTVYATVTAIASDTSLTVSAALGDGTSQTINRKSGALRVDGASGVTPSVSLMINDEGRVGIGTAAPTEMLDVRGTGNFGGSLTAPAGPDLFFVDIDPTIAASENDQQLALLRLRHRSAGCGAFTGCERPLLVTENAGGGQHNVQLFDTGLRLGSYAGGAAGVELPAAKLEIDGAGSTSATYALHVENLDGDDVFAVRNDGRVGVGTFAPEDTLHVAGGIRQSAAIDPTVVGSVTNASLDFAEFLDVAGKYAYVASLVADSLTVIDISDPTSPTVIKSISDPLLNGAIEVKVVGRYAYVTGFIADSLVIVDISDPSSPTIAGSLSGAALNGAEGLYISGKYAYVLANIIDELVIVDIGDPTAPFVVGSVASALMDSPLDVVVQGRYAYVTGLAADSLTMIDISDPTAPTVVASFTNAILDGAQQLYVSGRYAYVAAFASDALAIIDISDPSSISLAGSVTDATLLGGATSVDVLGRYAYVTARDADTLTVVDVSDPTAPAIVASLTDPVNMGNNTGMKVVGTYAFVTSTDEDRLTVVDLHGIDAAGANIGGVAASSASISDNLTVGNNAYVNGGLNVGPGGIYVDAGEVAIDGNSGSTVFRLGQRGTGDIVNVFDGAAEVFTIIDGGNVGIGDASPAALLTVGSGDLFQVDSSGNITTNGDLALNGGDLTTSAATFGLAALADTVHIAGGSGSTGCSVDSSGNLTCTGVLSGGGSGAFVNGGNSFGGTATLGTNDGFALNIETAGSTKMTVETDGDVSIGSGDFFFDATNRILALGSTDPFNDDLDGTGALYIQGAGASEYVGISMFSAHNGFSPATLGFFGSDGTVGTKTASADGDRLGVINFAGYDGTGLVYGTSIRSVIDGTVSAGIVPSRLEFRTADTLGTVGGVERLRITPDGNIGVGTSNPANFKFQIAGHVGPDADDTYDLGSNTLRWRDLYLGPASLHIGTSGDEAVISYDAASDTLSLDKALEVASTIAFANRPRGDAAITVSEENASPMDGADFMVDGTFDTACGGANWACAADWNIAGGVATYTDNGATSTLAHTDTFDIVAGERYKVTLDVTTTTPEPGIAAFYVQLNAAGFNAFAAVSATSAGASSHTLYIDVPESETGASFDVTVYGPFSAWEGSIDNVTLQPVDIHDAAFMAFDKQGKPILEIRGGAGTTSENLFMGAFSGRSAVTSAVGNTSVGVRSLHRITSGTYNTALGYTALASLTTGTHNTGLGFQSLSTTTTGVRNIGVGFSSMLNNLIGNRNIAIGYTAMYSNTASDDNTVVGYNAMATANGAGRNTGLGSEIFGALTDGDNNVAVGYDAGDTLTTGSGNTFVGYLADASSGTLTNATAIGANSVVGCSNCLVLGGTGANAVNVGIGTQTPADFGLQIAGHVGPDADDTYDLGSNTRRWRDLYLGPASIHMGTSGDEAVISYSADRKTIAFDRQIEFSGGSGLSVPEGDLVTPTGGFGNYVNHLLYSEQFENAAWTKTGVTVTADDAVSPDGLQTADRVNAGGSATDGVKRTVASPPMLVTFGNATWTGSVWLKAVAGTPTVTLVVDGNVTSEPGSNVVTLSDEWRRYSVTHTFTTGTGNPVFEIRNGTNAIHAWGAQLEYAADPGVYARTEGALIASNTAGVPNAGLVGNGSLLFSGSIGDTPMTGDGTRMMWVPSKSAFRAGFGGTTTWSHGNIGTYSAAFGYATRASGTYAFAGGNQSVASGTNAFAFGAVSTASGFADVAMGSNANATGGSSVALGGNAFASGGGALAFGSDISASQSLSVAIGQFVNATATNAMVIGGGLNTSNRIQNSTANSLMIGFNSNLPTLVVGAASGLGTTGNVGIGASSPTFKLDVEGSTGARVTGPSITGLTLKSTDLTSDFMGIRWRDNADTALWSMGNDFSGDGGQNFWLFDNVNGHTPLYIEPGAPSFLSLGTTDGGIGYNDATLDLELFTNGLTHFTLDGTGNVGIGVTNPGAKLDVLRSPTTGTADEKAVVFLTSSNRTGGNSYGLQLSSLESNAANNANVFGLDAFASQAGTSANTVRGINVSAAATGTNNTVTLYGVKIDDVGSAATSAGDHYGIRLDVTAGSGGTHYGIYSNVSGGSTAYAGIFTGGNVGIGTSSPGETLHVADTANEGNVFRVEDSTNFCDADPDGTLVWTCSSDARLKEGIVDAPSVLDQLLDLRIREFSMIGSDERMVGVIAQEVQEVMPGLVSQGDNGFYQVTGVTNWQLIKGLQELDARIEELDLDGGNGLLLGPDSAALDLQGIPIVNAGRIEGLGGLWSIDGNGRLAVTDAVAEKVHMKITDDRQTIGRATVYAGSAAAVVENPEISESSEIFITFRGDPRGPWFISEQHDGMFILQLAGGQAPEDVPFTYWIIDVADERTPEEATSATVEEVVDEEAQPTEETSEEGTDGEEAGEQQQEGEQPAETPDVEVPNTEQDEPDGESGDEGSVVQEPSPAEPTTETDEEAQ